MNSTAQELMDAAFDNYFELSNLLMQDLQELLDIETDTMHWRRNYIRASAALLEGYAHCLRDMCSISFVSHALEITKKEEKVLQSEQGFEAFERAKRTLSAAYKLFEIPSPPNFGGQEGFRAKRIFAKRHKLMHPRNVVDFEVSDELWIELRDDITWFIEQYFNFISALNGKYNKSP